MKKRGMGMACLIHANSVRYYYDSEGSAAMVKVHDDGSVTVLAGISDIGQGARTVMAHIAAEELGVLFEDVEVITGKGTDFVPDDLGAYASRSTFISGRAVQAAALDAKLKIYKVASVMLGVEPNQLESKERKIYVKNQPDKYVDFEKAVRAHLYDASYTGHTLFILGIGSVDVSGSEVPNRETGYGNAFATSIFASHVAEIEVDTDTGIIEVINHCAAVDLGRCINPLLAEGQIEGAVSQGVGYSLIEDMWWEKGKTLNPNFLTYKIPTALDVPEVTTVYVESIDPLGPFGAKGLGEPAAVPVAAAINNALYDAVGVRIDELPITPEKLLKALNEKQGQ